jgi:lipoprotein-anchoring transpeptidase ErfK/SrfK
MMAAAVISVPTLLFISGSTATGQTPAASPASPAGPPIAMPASAPAGMLPPSLIARAPARLGPSDPAGRPGTGTPTAAFWPEPPAELKAGLAWQIALERCGYSPGVLDGRPKAKTAIATREFQRATGLAVTGSLDAATVQALAADPDKALATYAVQQADLDKVGPLPKSFLAKSKQDRLPYRSLEEALAERFHCTRALLGQLNPGRSIAALRVGDLIVAPAIPEPVLPRGDRIEVHLTGKTVRVYAGDKLVGLFNCSVAAKKENLPSGSATVAVIVNNPTYQFDPAKWPEVRSIKQKLLLPPGPRNPVGLCWVGLSKNGYGIHGTPNPELIGKTGSHGCIRLTNWDAVRLGKVVRVGTPVTFIR